MNSDEDEEEDDEAVESGNDSEPEMFDNVLEKTGGPGMIDAADLTQSDEDEEPIKAPPPKRKLGPKPAEPAAKRTKIESSDSDASPIKKRVIN